MNNIPNHYKNHINENIFLAERIKELRV